MDIPRTREDVRDDLESIKERINKGLEHGRYTASELQRVLADRTRQAAHSTDQLVHDYPWSAIGLGVVIGLMIGALLPRR